MNHRYWLLPLTGIGFVVFVILAFTIGGDPPSADEASAEEIVAHYADNEGSVMLGVLFAGLAGISLIVFAAYLRGVLGGGAGPRDLLATTTLIGATILVVGLAIDGSIEAGLAQAAEDIDPTAVQALQAFWDNNFLAYAIGITLFLVSIGLALILYGALPAWLGWAAIVLVVLQFVAGIGDIDAVWVVFGIGTALWVIGTSVLFALQERREPAGTGTPPPAGTLPGQPRA